MSSSSDAERREILLVEYRAAQESAHHHDSLLWTSVSIVSGSMLVLLGFLLHDHDRFSHNHLFIAVGLLGLTLVIAMAVFVVQFNGLMNVKYERCKAIEQELGMMQHCQVRHLRGSQKAMLSVLGIWFAALWVWVVWSAW